MWVRFVDGVGAGLRALLVAPRRPARRPRVVYSVTDPPIKALRRFIPPLRIGNFALDLSMLLVFIGAYVLLRVNRAIFFLTTGRSRWATIGRPGAMVSTDKRNAPEHEWVRSCR